MCIETCGQRVVCIDSQRYAQRDRDTGTEKQMHRDRESGRELNSDAQNTTHRGGQRGRERDTYVETHRDGWGTCRDTERQRCRVICKETHRETDTQI